MKEITCLVITDLYVKDFDYEWEQRGKVYFTFKLDPDDVFNAEEIFMETIDRLLKDLSDGNIKYSYSSHELIFNEIKELKGYKEKFNELYSELY